MKSRPEFDLSKLFESVNRNIFAWKSVSISADSGIHSAVNEIIDGVITGQFRIFLPPLSLSLSLSLLHSLPLFIRSWLFEDMLNRIAIIVRDPRSRSWHLSLSPVISISLYFSREVSVRLSRSIDSSDLWTPPSRQLHLDIGEILDHFDLSAANPRRAKKSFRYHDSREYPMEIEIGVSVEMNRVLSAPWPSAAGYVSLFTIAWQCCIKSTNCINCNPSLGMNSIVPLLFWKYLNI